MEELDQGRPAAPRRQSTLNPALDPANSVAVTPGFGSQQEQDPLNGQTDDHGDGRPSSPTEAAKEATGEELLRRLSMTGPAPNPSPVLVDPREMFPNLNLSGRVISATFCVPYKISYVSESSWELHLRRGTSALFDSLAYLTSAQSPWQHTLVGWTGEIDREASESPAHRHANSSLNAHPVNKDSAPIPVKPVQSPTEPHDDSSTLRVSCKDRLGLEKLLSNKCGGRVAPVWLPQPENEDEELILEDQERWRRYGEHELFKLFHYKMNEPSDGRVSRKAWSDYYQMNHSFADVIMSIYKPGDVVMVHDYHLMLLPGLLRQRMTSIYVGFLLHIPFPSSEYYRCLPQRKQVLEGVLGANMVGFQAYSYSRHFSSCATRILGFPSSSAGIDAYGAHVAVDVFPAGIDVDKVDRDAFGSAEVDRRAKALRELYAGKKIIVGRDRLDAVRGVAQKLQAFERFLEKYPDWHDKVVLVQVTSLTSIEDRDDPSDQTANRINDLVARINGEYGSLSFTPVQHFPQYLQKDEYFALLRIADVGLITSVRDGMNTTALEYVICQRDGHGPLITSEFSGTAGNLGEALHVNPWDLSSTAATIDTALRMTTEERAAAHRVLYDQVTHNTVKAWTDSYVRRLLTNLASFDQSNATPLLDRTKLCSQYRKAKRRLFMFDYDGTLTPIVNDPQSAVPSDRVLRTLKALAADPKNVVWIVSGRDQAFLDEWMGHIPELGLSAEHGSFIRKPNQQQWTNLAESMDMGWQKLVLDEFQRYTDKTPGTEIERKKIAITWHYRRSDPEYGAYMARELQRTLERTVAQGYDVEIMTGKANLEVRPRFVNKGEIARQLVKTYEHLEFVLCLGDDFTDEDMFRALNSSSLPEKYIFAVTVGASSKQTLAHWHVLEPADVLATIAQLNGGDSDGQQDSRL
ncbi:glycosyltransferase family 20 protein [Piedraia hortae CBS 480.64]|uniref:Glycosyltransferase family 20 protein n=1 Tax=Piedraia hortae CBS 480.64 TaxID=1314780 RepID=A0A6A7C5F2_9PEZI|nr:glycosyltransferase family 20 protein [Piedraia hortae CBS 480.64]